MTEITDISLGRIRGRFERDLLRSEVRFREIEHARADRAIARAESRLAAQARLVEQVREPFSQLQAELRAIPDKLEPAARRLKMYGLDPARWHGSVAPLIARISAAHGSNDAGELVEIAEALTADQAEDPLAFLLGAAMLAELRGSDDHSRWRRSVEQALGFSPDPDRPAGEELAALQKVRETAAALTGPGGAGSALKWPDTADTEIRARPPDRSVAASGRDVTLPQSAPTGRLHSQMQPISELRMAIIADEFTSLCLSQECRVRPLSTQNWQTEIAEFGPDLLFVESCWRGNDGNWGTLTSGSGGRTKLAPVLRWCREHGVPTAFWNKEDPVHYDKFAPVACGFDFIFTSDADSAQAYHDDHGREVSTLMFGAAPSLHYPSASARPNGRVIFAGSYYGDKPKRCADWEELVRCVRDAGLEIDIYDRCLNLDVAKFEFPDAYKPMIRGHLLPGEVAPVAREYKYQININSVQSSPTMFARRVFESLASGVPVISNYSRAMVRLFGDTVLGISKPAELRDAIAHLEGSDRAYDDLCREGVRKVMREHCYGHRLSKVCQTLGLPFRYRPKRILADIAIESRAALDDWRANLARQTYPHRHVRFLLPDMEGLYELMSQSDETTSFVHTADIMPAVPAVQGDFDKFVSLGGTCRLEPSFLEDFVYWRP